MLRGTKAILAVGGLGSLIAVASLILGLASQATSQQQSGFGDPLPGLTADELARFLAGKALFEKVFTPATGLGPIFNGVSCAECHGQPATGGFGTIFETRIRVPESTTFINDLFLQPEGAPVIMNRSVGVEFPHELPGCTLQPEVVPVDTTAISFRKTFQTFGAGLIEAVPDETILANADPDDLDGDGVSGRPNFGTPPANTTNQVARFGWRPLTPDILQFTLGALQNEMGITNPPAFTTELRPQGNPAPPECDIAPDPEDDGSMAQLIADFQRFLAPPPRGKMNDKVPQGEVIFTQIGCAACHIPVLHTGPHPVAALSFKDVPLFSDLLIHDMGPELEDGVFEGTGTPREWRTTPLWGVGTSGRELLHDGRAGRDFKKAIMFHGGEGAGARLRFQQLLARDQKALIHFLKSL